FFLDGGLSSPDLHSLWAGLHGRAQLQAQLRGTQPEPVLQLSGTVGDLVFRNYRAGRAVLDAQLALKSRSDLRLELEDVDAWVALRSASLTLSGTREKHSARFEARGETAAGEIALRGGAEGRRWRGQLTEARFAPGAGQEWRLEEPAPLGFNDGRLSVDPVCLAGGESRACVQTQISAVQQHVAFSARQFELKHLQGLLQDDWTIAGTLSGTASVTVARGELHDLRADLVGSKGLVAVAGVRLDYGPGEFQVRSEGQSLRAHLRLTPAGGVVSGDLLLSPAATLLDRRIQGDIRLKLPDLAWLPVLSREIAAAEGALTGDLRASGTVRSPSLDGRVQLAGGRVQLATPGIEFTHIGAKFESSARAPLAVSITANAGEGRLKLDGEMLALRPDLAGKFTLTGDNAQLFNTPEIRAWVTPDLQLALREGTARLTGELKVTGALITPREIGGGGVAPSSDQVLVSETGEPPGGLNIESEVRIVLGEAVRFDGLGLKTRLTGAITAFDDPGRPTRARGELQLAGGRYKAYGQDLQIETGRLLFNGGLVTDPAIDISAYREPREDIKVGLRARGTLDAPQFSLYSTPAMSQEEQLSWLILGRSLSETLKAGAGAELGGAAMSLGLTGSDYLAQQLGTRLGFDQVSVGAKPGETADKARMTIGKYLSPKLFVSYGVGL
ncbi:MAG: translocation/assembly module TamB domain-containing protein, partial [Hydrocarboniphaga effusa]|nr:translocation/assembly module TamB domain-containing protein [Hydrocarboniphaga effusa]